MAEVTGKKIMGLSKNQAIFVAIGGAATVFLVYRHYKNASAVVNDTSSTGTGTDTSSDIDPETGYAYGSTEDEEALAGLSGEASGDAYGTLTSEPYYSTVATTQTPTTNAAWSQYVQQQLGTIGYDPETVAGAIGAYLSQIPLTATQAGIVQVALAECGPPPQGEYSIIPQGTSTTTTATVPNCAGGTTGAAHNLIVAAGLTPTDANSGNSGEAQWTCTGTTPAAGTKVVPGSDVAINSTKPVTPTPSPSPSPTPAKAKTYTVVSGDTLSGIAAKYGISWQTLYNANKGVVGSNPNLIRPGEVLTIP